ncbi:translation initiation factor eIF 4e-like domain-containing protein [Globomyces pollinis-pini]|nr:translation initiation factor eIF 4e-like domain-containing protein [Globomyces pollinis-pini]
MTDNPIYSFNDPVNYTVKHPLQNNWTLWYDDPAAMKNTNISWDENLKTIMTVNSIEDFFGLVNHIKKPSDIPISANYHLFKTGVRPAWEDKENSKGGKWTFGFNRQKRTPEIDPIWMNIMLALIGEQFDHSDDITGAVISIRKGVDRIAIWTKSYDNPERTIRIGEQFKSFLDTRDRIGFQAHSDTAVKTGSTVKDRYNC